MTGTAGNLPTTKLPLTGGCNCGAVRYEVTESLQTAPAPIATPMGYGSVGPRLWAIGILAATAPLEMEA